MKNSVLHARGFSIKRGKIVYFDNASFSCQKVGDASAREKKIKCMVNFVRLWEQHGSN